MRVEDAGAATIFRCSKPLCGPGRDVLVWLAAMTPGYLACQDRSLMLRQKRLFRSWIHLHLRA